MIKTKSAITMAILSLLFTVAISGCFTAHETAEQTTTPMTTVTQKPSDSLKDGLRDIPNYSIVITGGNISPVTLTYADLLSMDFVDTGNVSKMKMSGSGIETTADYAGVPIPAILARAGVPSGNNTFRISAPDGYEMDYSQTQIASAILGLKQDGAPSTDDVNAKNAIVLVMPGQRGPMWIKVPTKIEIVKA
ncbi:MAG TPA: hypothetical protein VK436_08980 [Methanocella sp.]|nr:hypothetical protein [Methanocella sp.]